MKQLIVFMTLTWIGCSKDSNDVSRPLNLGSYKAISLLYSPAIDYNHDGKFETECIDYIDPCSIDDLITFISDSEGEYNYGSSNCSFETPTKWKFTWKYLSSNSKIAYTYSNPNFTDTATIEIINQNEFNIKYFESKGSNPTYYSAIEKYVRQ